MHSNHSQTYINTSAGSYSFNCNRILELIEGKLFQPTRVGGVPEISWLGIYPYLETLTPQVILLIAALVALWITLRRNHLPTAQIKNNISTL